MLSRLLGGSSSRNKRREESWGRAQKAGPPDALQSLNPLARGGSDYELERKRRRNEIQQKFYSPGRKRLVRRRQQAERSFRDSLRRQQEKIEGYYRCKEKSLGEERAQEKVKERFRREEREMTRKFRKTWQDQESDLKRQRDRKYRQITKEMHKESREARGLPDRTQW